MSKRVSLSLMMVLVPSIMMTPPAMAGSSGLNLDRFAGEIAVFARQDAATKSVSGGTLLVGSSSIRLWNVEQGFPQSKVINRGFGGATTPEVLHYYRQIVSPYQPASIVVYVGENDIAAGAEPEVVAADVLTLLGRIRHDNPRARIAYLSMKPSPARWKLWSRMTAANALIRAQADTADFDFLDAGSSLLAKDGTPSGELYRTDGLHLSDGGYAIWKQVLDKYMAKQVKAAQKKLPVPKVKPQVARPAN